MNKDAEKYLKKLSRSRSDWNLNTAEVVLREAMEFAYRDAAKVANETLNPVTIPIRILNRIAP